MKVVAFLPAKGTSERIKNKNTMMLDSKPLFLYTLEKLMTCDFIDEVYLDTESDVMYEMARYTGCIYLKREQALASNATDGHSLFYNEVRQVNADIYIQILGTSPFISIGTIKKAVDILHNNTEYDSVVLVKREKQYLWNDDIPAYDKNHVPNSKDLPDTVIETMGLYATNNYVANTLGRRYGERPYLLNATPLESVDVNYPEDFKFAEIVAKGIRASEINLLNFLRKLVDSAMISDILDDIGISSVISGLKCNIVGTKVFGRAKTLKIRAMKENEDFRGIYDALDSYAQVTDNDIIIVENECSDFAYFGELNSMLAIRAGASATIIGGVTRDQDAVRALNYPVFSTGYNCRDVRKRAVMENFNQKIQIQGVIISPNDLIFADGDGIVVIPRKKEKEVISLLLNKITSERSVASEIVKNTDPKAIINKVGEF
ncbi:MAG: cytidyltransferase [Lachnospiraceae bacterium]|nr:cytidyltransferase [Lachnospiraceae bacterium]